MVGTPLTSTDTSNAKPSDLNGGDKHLQQCGDKRGGATRDWDSVCTQHLTFSTVTQPSNLQIEQNEQCGTHRATVSLQDNSSHGSVSPVRVPFPADRSMNATEALN